MAEAADNTREVSEPSKLKLLTRRNLAVGAALALIGPVAPVQLVSGDWITALCVAGGLALLVLVSTPGKAWRVRRRLPLPGLLIAPAAAVLLLVGLTHAADQMTKHAQEEMGRTGAQRIIEAQAALQAGDLTSAERILAPVEEAGDDRVTALTYAVSALRRKDGDRMEAGRWLVAKANDAGEGGDIYRAAVNEIDPTMLAPLEAEAQRAEEERAAIEAGLAANRRYDSLFSGWDGSNRTVVRAVKQMMNDPSSFEHVETRHAKLADGTIQIVMTYRGKNAFGGVVTERVVAKLSEDGKLLSLESAGR